MYVFVYGGVCGGECSVYGGVCSVYGGVCSVYGGVCGGACGSVYGAVCGGVCSVCTNDPLLSCNFLSRCDVMSLLYSHT